VLFSSTAVWKRLGRNYSTTMRRRTIPSLSSALFGLTCHRAPMQMAMPLAFHNIPSHIHGYSVRGVSSSRRHRRRLCSSSSSHSASLEQTSINNNNAPPPFFRIYYNDVYKVHLPPRHRFPMEKYVQVRTQLQQWISDLPQEEQDAVNCGKNES
jgi:hypothetical protein